MKKTFRLSDEAQKALTKIQKRLDLSTENATVELVLKGFEIRSNRINELEAQVNDLRRQLDERNVAIYKFKAALKVLDEMPSM